MVQGEAMGLGDVLFVAAFIVLPLGIVVLCLWALRPPKRPARHGDAESAMTTTLPARDWSLSVQPVRRASPRTTLPAGRAFCTPAYRGRSGGVVRRLGSGGAERHIR